MNITIEAARSIALTRLDEMESEINSFGSGLPGHKDRSPISLLITHEWEIPDGWVFSYNSREYIDDGVVGAALAGNFPLFISRVDGGIYCTSDPQYRGVLDLIG